MAQVHAEIEAGVVTLTLDDEKRKNAMSPALGDALEARVRELRGSAEVRVCVLTGAGGAFSAGGDLAMLEQLSRSQPAECEAFMLSFYRRYLSILDLGVPVIAAVVGPAIGAGLCLALACHLLVVDERSKLALNFVALGLHPGMGATYFAPRKAGWQRGAELLLTGRRFDGVEAARMGLALEALPADAVLARARAIAAQIAAGGPLATAALADELGPDRAALEAALAREAKEQARSYGSADFAEGMVAAAARRAPLFRGG